VPTATARDGTELYYELSGSGETVTFVGEAGYGAWQWGWQHARMAGPLRTLVWDLRGTGRSDAPGGPYDVATLVRDLEAVLAAANVRETHLVGAGLGGMVALAYARRYGRARTLALYGTAASGEAVDERALRALFEPRGGRESLSGAFSEAFLASEPDLIEQISRWRAEEDAAPKALEAQIAAVLGFDAGARYEVTQPALVCHGLDDPVVAFEAGEQLAAELPRGAFEAVEGRHLCHVEHSRAVTDRTLAFFEAER